MATYVHQKPTDAPVNEQLDGEYPFEVVKLESSINYKFGTEEKGSDYIELKLCFYKDTTFTQKVAQWTETLVLHPKWEWKLHQFNEAANVLIEGQPIKPGDSVAYEDETMIGLRGWARCKPQAGTKDPSKKYNRVQIFLTDKPKIARAVPAATGEHIPF